MYANSRSATGSTRLPSCPARNGSRLILSVDDERTILYTREVILQREGYDVLSAPDGEQALRLFSAHEIDLVLLDFVMPGLDGGVVARRMKLHNPQVPLIMVSANHVPEGALACTDAFVHKGDGPLLLLQQIQRLLASPQALRRCA